MREAKELGLSLAAETLRQRCLWGGLLLLLGACIPYEQVLGTPYFLWQLWWDLPTASQLFAASTPAAGLLIMVLGWRKREPTPLAFGALVLVIAPQIIAPTGRAASSWFAAAPPFGPVAHDLCANLSLAAAATSLSLGGHVARPRTARRWAFFSLLAACLFVALGCGNRDFFHLLLGALGRAKDASTSFGLGVLLCLQCWPLLVAAVASLSLLVGPWRHGATLGLVATFGYPLCGVVLAMLQGSLGGHPNAGAAQLLNALLLASELALMGAALTTLAWLSVQGPPRTKAEDKARKQFGGWALTAATLLLALFLLHRLESSKHRKGLSWTIGAAPPAATRLFTLTLPHWSARLKRWRPLKKDPTHGDSGRWLKRFEPVRKQAEKVDAVLAQRLTALAREADDLKAPPRRWYRRVAEANARARELQLPFYLDPRLSFKRSRRGALQKKEIATYRLVESPSFQVDGQLHTVLLVQQLTSHGQNHRSGLLGLSRDHQPFSVVLVDEVSSHADELRRWAVATPPTCGQSNDPKTMAALRRCGLHLKQVVATSDEKLVSSQLNQAIRHELQHQLDGPTLPMAALRSPPAKRRSRRYRKQLNREVSAFLAEAGGHLSDAKLALTTLLMLALQQQGGIHQAAAQAIFVELAPRGHQSGSSRSEVLVATYEALTRQSDTRLRMTIRNSWKRLYGRPLQQPNQQPSP